MLDYAISSYRYENDYPPEDNFLDVIKQLLAHQVVVLATPVYWYAMSGILKTFFDRLTDLVTVQKLWAANSRAKRFF